MNLETLTVKLTTDLSSFKQGMQQATQQTTTFAQTATKSFGNIGKQLLSGLGIAVSLGLITKFGKACVNAAGNANSLYKVLSQNSLDKWNSTLTNINAEWERFKVVIGSILIEILIPLTNALAVVLNMLSNVASKIFNVFRRAKNEISATSKAMKAAGSSTGFDELNTVKTSSTEEDSDKTVNALNDIKEKVAAIAIAVAAIAAVQNVDKISSLFETLAKIAVLFSTKEGIITGLNIIKSSIGTIFTKFSGIGASIKTIASSLGIWPVIILAVVAAIVLAWQNSEKFRDTVKELWEGMKGFFNDVKPYIDEMINAFSPFLESIKGLLAQLWETIKPILITIGEFLGVTLMGAITVITGFLAWITPAITKVATVVMNFLTNVFNTLSRILEIIENIFSFDFKEAWSDIKGLFSGGTKYNYSGRYADGGYPTTGSLFIAREAGPEMVGSIGNQTAVANNNQITTAIASAVYNAIKSAGGLNGGSTNVTLELDGTQIGQSVVNYHNNVVKRTGRSPLLV